MNWIKRHLADCKNCCAVYEYLRSSDRYDDVEKKKDMNLVKDLKAGIQKRKRRSISAVFVILIAGILFVRRYSIPVPFDANRMFIETVPSVFTVFATLSSGEFKISILHCFYLLGNFSIFA